MSEKQTLSGGSLSYSPGFIIVGLRDKSWATEHRNSKPITDDVGDFF